MAGNGVAWQVGAVQIRPATPADSAAIGDLITVAFGEEGTKVAAVWRDVVGGGLDRSSLVTVDDGDVVGHVGLSHSWLDARERLVDVLVLSPLSVHPERQRHGIGTALLAAALDAGRSLATPAVFLEGDPRYYGRRGFARASKHGFETAPVVRPTRRSRSLSSTGTSRG